MAMVVRCCWWWRVQRRYWWRLSPEVQVEEPGRELLSLEGGRGHMVSSQGWRDRAAVWREAMGGWREAEGGSMETEGGWREA